MSMKQLIWLAPLALAACGQKGEVDLKKASVTEVADKMRESGVAATSLKPGMWEATVKLDSIAAPGMPEVQQQMQANAGQARTITECLTAETAKKPFDRFIVGVADDCSYEHFTMGGGRIDNKLVCSNAQSQRTIATQGTYDKERYSLKINSETTGGPIPKTVMAMSLDARRTGACPATQG
jgi:predicted small lipoprotein YifL